MEFMVKDGPHLIASGCLLPFILLYFSSWHLSINAVCVIFIVIFIWLWSVSLTELMNKMLYEGKNLVWLTDAVAQYT